jgi:hypothetical protein
MKTSVNSVIRGNVTTRDASGLFRNSNIAHQKCFKIACLIQNFQNDGIGQKSAEVLGI